MEFFPGQHGVHSGLLPEFPQLSLGAHPGHFHTVQELLQIQLETGSMFERTGDIRFY